MSKEDLKDGCSLFHFCETCNDGEKKKYLGFGDFDLPDLIYETKCAECRNLANMYFYFKSCKYMYSLTTPEYELKESGWRKVRGISRFNLPTGQQVTSFRIKVSETTKFAVIINQDGSEDDKIGICERNSSMMQITLEKYGYQCEVLSSYSSHETLSSFLNDLVEKWKRHSTHMKVFFYFTGLGFRTPEGFILMKTSDNRFYKLQDFIYQLKGNLELEVQEEEEEEEEKKKRSTESEFFFVLDCFHGKSQNLNERETVFRFTKRGSEINLDQFHLRMSISSSMSSFCLEEVQNVEQDRVEKVYNSRFLRDIRCSFFTHSFVKAVEEWKGGDFGNISKVQVDYMEGIFKVLTWKGEDIRNKIDFISIDGEKTKKMDL